MVAAVRGGTDPRTAQWQCGGPAAARAFAVRTLDAAETLPVHARVAMLLYGREDLIPAMFREIVRPLVSGGLRARLLMRYLDRHIEVDDGEHRELAERLLARLCGGDDGRWREAWQSLDAFADAAVTLHTGTSPMAGVARGVDERGALRLETTTGIQTVYGGEISLRAAS